MTDLRFFPPDLTTSQLRQFKAGYRADRFERMIERLRSFDVPFLTAVDVGAYIGDWTVMLAKHYELVVAFEPNATNFSYLHLNTQHVKNVRIKNLALSNVRKLVGNVAPKGSLSNQVRSGGRLEAVPLDHQEFGDVSLLKIHVNGHEAEVVDGALLTIERYRPAVFVVAKENENVASSIARVCELLIPLDYELVDVNKPDYLFLGRSAV